MPPIVNAPSGNSLRDAKAAVDSAVFLRLSTPPMTKINGNPIETGSFMPSDECYPYAVIGESDSSGSAQWTSKTSGGMEFVYLIDLWSKAKGTAELNFIADQVLTRLTSTKLDLSGSGFNLARHKLETDITQRMTDGQTMRRMLRFRLQVQDLVTIQPTP